MTLRREAGRFPQLERSIRSEGTHRPDQPRTQPGARTAGGSLGVDARAKGHGFAEFGLKKGFLTRYLTSGPGTPPHRLSHVPPRSHRPSLVRLGRTGHDDSIAYSCVHDRLLTPRNEVNSHAEGVHQPPFFVSLVGELGESPSAEGRIRTGAKVPTCRGSSQLRVKGIAGRRVGHPCDLRIADLEVWGVGQNSQ
jgi:hypothetical protein